MRFSSTRRRSLAGAALALTLSACGGGGDSSTPPTPTPPPIVEVSVTHKVRLSTTLGVIELGLDRTKAPATVDNFLAYVNERFYNGTVFHRVIKDFVIQGGGFARGASNVLVQKPTRAAIVLESNKGLSNLRGTIAMARTSDPNSATSQFFINTVDNKALDYPGSDGSGGYAVFGKVTAGLDVVDRIRAVATSQDLPLVDVTITDAVVLP